MWVVGHLPCGWPIPQPHRSPHSLNIRFFLDLFESFLIFPLSLISAPLAEYFSMFSLIKYRVKGISFRTMGFSLCEILLIHSLSYLVEIEYFIELASLNVKPLDAIVLNDDLKAKLRGDSLNFRMFPQDGFCNFYFQTSIFSLILLVQIASLIWREWPIMMWKQWSTIWRYLPFCS